MKLTGEQFNEFFNEKKSGTFKCPICSNETFLMNGWVESRDGPSPEELAVLTLPASASDGRQGAHTFFSISCANCGHTEFFHAKQLTNWLEKKGLKNG